MTRVRSGWYADARLHPLAIRAARVGARLTCVSAAEYLGSWVPHDHGDLHVAAAANACQLRDPDDHTRRLTSEARVIVHWDAAEQPERARRATRVMLDIESVLAHVIRCTSARDAHAIVESALRLGHVDRLTWHRVLGSAPREARRALARVGSLSESGTESIAAFGLHEAAIAFRQQVWFGRDRVDIVIGDRLVIEIDSHEFHDARRDSARDLRLMAQGLTVLHFGYAEVMFAWPTVLAVILAAMSRGDHIR